MKWKRDKYSFSHPKAKAPMVFKAFSEEGARKKMRSFVISVMFGDWALFYNAAKVDEIMRQVTITKL